MAACIQLKIYDKDQHRLYQDEKFKEGGKDKSDDKRHSARILIVDAAPTGYNNGVKSYRNRLFCL